MAELNSTMPIPRVLLKRVGSNWHAIGLEHAVCAWAEELEDIMGKFYEALAIETAYGMRHGDPSRPLESVRPAPKNIWREYEDAEPYGELANLTVMTLEAGDQAREEVPTPMLADSVRMSPTALAA